MANVTCLKYAGPCKDAYNSLDFYILDHAVKSIWTGKSCLKMYECHCIW